MATARHRERSDIGDDDAEPQISRQERRAKQKAAHEKTRGVRDRSKRTRPAQDRQRAAKRAQREQRREIERELQLAKERQEECREQERQREQKLARIASPSPAAAPPPQPVATAAVAPLQPAAAHPPQPVVVAAIAPPPPAAAAGPCAAIAGPNAGTPLRQVTLRRSKVLDAMINTRTVTGDTAGAAFIQQLRTAYQNRTLDSGQVRRRLIKRIGRAQLNAEMRHVASDLNDPEQVRLQSGWQPSYTGP